MDSLIDVYLEDHESAWAASTWKSEKARLNALRGKLNGKPEDLHKWLKEQGYKPYGIKTIFIRLCSMESWCRKTNRISKTPFTDYVHRHANRFKHAYKKEDIQITYNEALRRIDLSLAEPHRSMALSLLRTGLRLSEAYKVSNGMVTGKGEKTRKVYGTIEMTASKHSLSRKLKAIGLKPHTLRKLCATRLAEKGASAADLCKVFGWSSITTSYQYLQAKDDERLAALMEESQEG